MDKKTIMLVEDDKDQAMAMGIRLRSSGYDVVLAMDAYQGVADARTTKPDLILLDLGLPAGGGFTVLKTLKELMDTAMIPIIVLTATDPGANLERALIMGAEAFFQKPADNAALLKKIRWCLGENIEG